VLMDAKDVE
jgi:hypothetical protein